MDHGDVDVEVWSGFMWLRIFTICRACVNMMMHILFHTRWEIWHAEWLLNSQGMFALCISYMYVLYLTLRIKSS